MGENIKLNAETKIELNNAGSLVDKLKSQEHESYSENFFAKARLSEYKGRVYSRMVSENRIPLGYFYLKWIFHSKELGIKRCRKHWVYGVFCHIFIVIIHKKSQFISLRCTKEKSIR